MHQLSNREEITALCNIIFFFSSFCSFILKSCCCRHLIILLLFSNLKTKCPFETLAVITYSGFTLFLFHITLGLGQNVVLSSHQLPSKWRGDLTHQNEWCHLDINGVSVSGRSDEFLWRCSPSYPLEDICVSPSSLLFSIPLC